MCRYIVFIQFIFVLLLCVPKYSYSQCSVDNVKTDKGEAYIHTREKIYDEEEDGDGLYFDGGRIATISAFAVSKSSSGDIAVSFLVKVGTVGMDNLVPRKIRINFSGASSLTLEATTYDKASGDGAVAYESTFPIEPDDELEKIISNSTSSITVIDSRNGEKVTGRPYDRLLSEQLKCVIENV